VGILAAQPGGDGLTMRMVIVAATDPPADLPQHAVVCHDVRNPEQRSEVLVRKGSALTAAEIVPLLARGVAELHLAVPEPSDVGEDEAAQRLGVAVAGPAVAVGTAHFGQVSFTSAARGVVRIDASQLNVVNSLEDVLLLTAESDRPVDVGETLGVVKCAPLFLQGTLLEVETIATAAGPVLRVESFRPMSVGFIAPLERLRGGALERARTALSQALAWYGSSMETTVGVEASVDAMAAGYRDLLSGGAQLILAAGAAGTDPCDVVFEGLRRAGGEVVQIGIPAEPGTACWIGELDSTPVLGLASCELFGQPGALDLLLPRLFTGDALDRDLLRRIAPGGLLLGPSRIAPFHARNGTAD
jgi:molybdenum cofactor cytidylyltransferase